MTALVAHRAFLDDVLTRQASRRALVDPAHPFPEQPLRPEPAVVSAQPSKANVVNHVPEEETIRNDYAGWYGVSGAFGSNHVLGAGDEEICEE